MVSALQRRLDAKAAAKKTGSGKLKPEPVKVEARPLGGIVPQSTEDLWRTSEPEPSEDA